MTIGGSAFTVELREAMTYCGRTAGCRGARSRTGSTAPLNESFVLPNVTYDALDNTTSLGYPQCTHAACAAPSPRTVNFTYGDDLLSAVGIPGNAGYYASALSYYPNLMVSQVVHTNNPADSLEEPDRHLRQRPEPDARARPRSR